MLYSETPTKGKIMSAETTAPKKSILTNAMENARNKMQSDNSDDYSDHPTIKAEHARFKKLAIIATVGVTALVTAAIIISNRADDAKTTDTDENPED